MAKSPSQPQQGSTSGSPQQGDNTAKPQQQQQGQQADAPKQPGKPLFRDWASI